MPQLFDIVGKTIANWYQIHKRVLPWRETTDAYKIWISEIILQQTRVDQALGYFSRFVERFPNVESLAQASEEEVLKYWQGLGYYSRARNLHFAAQHIVAKHHSIFPSSHKEVLALKGIGDYTAAAICSFSYNMPYAVVDGNVFRVLSRLFGITTPINSTQGKKEFSLLAEKLLNKKNPSLHNQAIMEFGALQCVPKSPNCIQCPLQEFCVAFASNLVKTLPVKTKKIVQRERFFNYFFIKKGTETILQKRTQNDIWKNLYQFPLIETEKLSEVEDLLKHPFLNDKRFVIKKTSSVYKHVLSHQIIYARFFTIETYDDLFPENKEFIAIPISNLSGFPVPRLMEIFIEKNLEN
ncbi:MAG: A/G-specific adenine glycosylase [Paludibacteraceae bacterium]|nr:A/G-specific adenine glycosylase [Paludibacteraceae bacterium]